MFDRPGAPAGALAAADRLVPDTVACERCGRRVAADRYDAHCRACYRSASKGGFRATITEPGGVPTVWRDWAAAGDDDVGRARGIDSLPCEFCGRSFTAERRNTHVAICARTLGAFRASVTALDALDRRASVAAEAPWNEENEENIPPPRDDAAADEGGERVDEGGERVDAARGASAPAVAEIAPVAAEIDPVAAGVAFGRCEHCGRSFSVDRLAVHRRICAQGLPGWRGAVKAMDAADAEADAVAAERRRAELAEAQLERLRAKCEKMEAEQRTRADEAEAAVQAAGKRAELAEAAAKSMEASYDIVAEALAKVEKKEAEQRARADEAEAVAQAADKRRELAEAAAKSMEAAHDVVAEALARCEKREAELRAAAGAGGAASG